MEIFILFIVLGIVVGMIAKSKGRSFFPWFIYGAMLFLVALVHVLISKPANTGLKCPDCISLLSNEAKVCKYCGYRFKKDDSEVKDDKKEILCEEIAKPELKKTPTSKPKGAGIKVFIGIIILFAVIGSLARIIYTTSPKVEVNQSDAHYKIQSLPHIPYITLSNGTLSYIIIDSKYLNTNDLNALGQELSIDYASSSFERISIYDNERAVKIRDSVINDQATKEDIAFYDAHYVAQYNKNNNTNYNEFSIYQDGSGQMVNKIINY